MKTASADADGVAREVSSLTGSHRRTLEAIFRHPSAHNLEWSDVVALIGKIGDAHEKSNNEFVFEVAGKRHLMRRPHTKDLTSAEVLELRQFLLHSHVSPDLPSQPPAHPLPPAPSLLVVVDHHGARVFEIELALDDTSEPTIRPYDPHHFLHHRNHKDQSREIGQRAPEEPAYYDRIAEALALGGEIVIIGHGTGKSNAAHHLTEYLKSHHRGTYLRIVREMAADLSRVTEPRLLELAREALRP
jgi:hypothetical protein